MRTAQTIVFIVIVSMFLNASGSLFAKPPGRGTAWKIIWQDEFDGEKIDMSKWEFWHPDQKRRIAINRAHNTYLDGKGNLVIRTQKEGDAFTAGGLWTPNTFRHRFGYWEFRCSFEEINNIGHWPACWI